MASIAYPGLELKLFEQAHNWKSYWSSRIAPYVRGSVLEVGAGIGANTRLLASLHFARWTCLEPDPALAQQIELPPGGRHGLTLGTIDDLDAAQRFDSILYIDVLEHIAEDGAEMARAAARVRPGDGLYVHPYMPVLYFLTQAHNPTRYSYLAPGMMAGREEQQTLQALEQRPPAWVLYLPLTREEYLRVFPNAKGLNHQFIGIEQWIARNYTATGLAIGGYQLRQRRVNP